MKLDFSGHSSLRYVILVTILLGGAAASVVMLRVPAPEQNAMGIAPLQPVDHAGFERARPNRVFDFPADQGPHPEYQTEWWYYTGNLTADSGEQFGYQLTFFRRGLSPPAMRGSRDSRWAADDVFLAHFALTDVAEQKFMNRERTSRGGAIGIAGAASEPFRVWLENWSVEAKGRNIYLLHAEEEDIQITLRLEDAKGPVLQGDGGYSRKGPGIGAASYYYSQTRLLSTGTVTTLSGTDTVSGLSWMDHEFSTSALSAGQVGWDWFGLQLDDGTELTLFQLRRDDGSIDTHSSGMIVHEDGVTTSLEREAFEIDVLDMWHSPHSNADYPAEWTIRIPQNNLEIHIVPLLDDQELNVTYSYWEGAVAIEGVAGGRRVTGSGYVELTGYVGSMEGQF